MDIHINGNIDELSTMLACAVRYALGRRTYIVEWVCDFIKNNLHLILEKDKKVMIKDIKECRDYGWDCDREQWLSLLKTLKDDIR